MQKTLSHLIPLSHVEMKTLRFSSRIHLGKRNLKVVECPYWRLKDRTGCRDRGFCGRYLCLEEILEAGLIIRRFGLCFGSFGSSCLNFTCV